MSTTQRACSWSFTYKEGMLPYPLKTKLNMMEIDSIMRDKTMSSSWLCTILLTDHVVGWPSGHTIETQDHVR